MNRRFRCSDRCPDARFRRAGKLGALALAVALEAGARQEGGAPSVSGGLGERLDAVAAAAVAEGFNGVVLVAKGGAEILAKGYGVANVATAARFTPETVVQIGSNVKDFTKVAIFQLAEAGKLALGDPISRFFPDAPPDKAAITVDQLLDHRSGLPLGVARPGGGRSPDDDPMSWDQFRDRLWSRALEFAPGTSERYSNAGYSLLARIVEQLAGESFDAYVARAVLRPLGLRDTGFLAPRFDPSRLAHGYENGEDMGTMLDRPHDASGHLWALRGNGGYVATVRDQLRFFRAMARGELLRDPEHRRRVFSADGPAIYAGSDNVCFFLFASFPREGFELVLASNRAEFPASRLLERFEPLLGIAGLRRTNHEIDPPATPAEFPESGPGRTVAAWFAAYASGDEAVMRRFFEAHAASGPQEPPVERRLENFRRMRGTLGELTPVAVDETPEGVEVTVRTEKGERARFGFDVEPQAPYRLRGIRIEVG